MHQGDTAAEPQVFDSLVFQPESYCLKKKKTAVFPPSTVLYDVEITHFIFGILGTSVSSKFSSFKG